MDYSDSDVYCGNNSSSLSEAMGPPRYPMTNTAKRSLEDRVRDYTGQSLRHDERHEHPAGSSSGRSSDSRSPFLDNSQRRGKARAGGREMMLQETEYETPHVPATLRGDTIWETKLDQGIGNSSTTPHLFIPTFEPQATCSLAWHILVLCYDASRTNFDSFKLLKA